MGTFLQRFGISKQAVTWILIVLLVVLLSCLLQMWRRRKESKEKEQHVIRRMREDALDRALANPMAVTEAEPFEQQRRPFQVEYSKGEDAMRNGDSRQGMYQLTEVTELSQRKYMFRCQEQVLIGDQFGTVTILPGIAHEDQIFCQMFFYQQEHYLRSTGKQEVVLKRKGKQLIVNQNGVKLCSGDWFTVGKTSYQFTVI